MAGEQFIAGDWGTSNLRLYLCQADRAKGTIILERHEGPGASRVEGDFESTLFELVGDWIRDYTPRRILLSGMVGSSIGWQEAPYLPCPADTNAIIEGRLEFPVREQKVSIVAGLKTSNPLGSVDVMRGEELQLLGWMQRNPDESQNTRLFALPGTHNKWALINKGKIETFLTAFTGELFELLRTQSILITDSENTRLDTTSFIEGLQAVERLGDGQLLHALFSTRSQQVLGELSADKAPSYLSGLLIGADVIGALGIFGAHYPELDCITLIGNSGLSKYYQLALEHLKLEVDVSSSEEVALAGYTAIYHLLENSNL